MMHQESPGLEALPILPIAGIGRPEGRAPVGGMSAMASKGRRSSTAGGHATGEPGQLDVIEAAKVSLDCILWMPFDRMEGIGPGPIEARQKLFRAAAAIAEAPGVATVADITPAALRRMIVHLRKQGSDEPGREGEPYTREEIEDFIRHVRLILMLMLDCGLLHPDESEGWSTWLPPVPAELLDDAGGPDDFVEERPTIGPRPNIMVKAEMLAEYKTEQKCSNRDVARRFQISEYDVSRHLKLTKLPDAVKARIRAVNRFPLVAALEITRVASEAEQLRKVDQVIAGELGIKHLQRERLRRGDKIPAAPPSVVQLRGKAMGPIVLGREKPPLSIAQYHAVSSLLRGGVEGCRLSDMDEWGPTGWHKVLNRLKASDPDWDAVIHFPGRPYGRYRIAAPLLRRPSKIDQEVSRGSISTEAGGADSLGSTAAPPEGDAE